MHKHVWIALPAAIVLLATSTDVASTVVAPTDVASTGTTATGTTATAAAPTPLVPALTTQPITRTIVRKIWKPQWMRGGKREDELFAMPRELVATSTGVIVADAGGLEILAFANTGKLQWKFGRKGSGPGEFQELGDLTFDAAGNLAVLDPRNARITYVSREGQLRRSVGTSVAGWPTDLCLLNGGQIVLTTSAADRFAIVTDSLGKSLRTLRFPWPTEPSAPSFLRSVQMARGTAHDQCWIATTFGFGLASIRASGTMAVTPFVEAVAPPMIRKIPSTPERKGSETLERGDNAALAAFTHGDTLFVYFMGKQGRDKPLLDLYNARGQYIESWTIPGAEGIAYSQGMLYTLINTMENPILIAFRLAP